MERELKLYKRRARQPLFHMLNVYSFSVFSDLCIFLLFSRVAVLLSTRDPYLGFPLLLEKILKDCTPFLISKN